MAVQGEIVAKLKTIPGVVEAHVTIVKPKRDVIRDLADKPPPATASITILYNQVDGKMPFKIEDVQRLVAGCVEGLDAQQVTVVSSLNRPATKRMMNPSGDDDSGGVDSARAPTAMGGVKVVDEANKKKLNTMLMGGGIALIVVLVAFIGVLVAFFGQRSALTKVQAELASKKKAQAVAAPPPA
jgi:type III secretory pathway lipoprotein EscJ